MIGARLLDLRIEAGLTQKELADILHINMHSISSYERNKSEAPDDTKIAIAQYFHVSVDFLLGLTENRTSAKETYLRIPNGFPKEAIGELRDFALFLKERYR